MGGQPTSSGQVVGYARVSAADQNLDRQLAALGSVDEMFTDHASGASTARPGLQHMLQYVRRGDIVRVKSPDRLARSAEALLEMLRLFDENGVAIEFIDSPNLSTTSPSGKFMITVLAAVAEFERSLIKERQAEGIAIARARGKYAKAPRLTKDQVQTAHELVDQGVPKSVIARRLGVGRQTLYTALRGDGAYAGLVDRQEVEG